MLKTGSWKRKWVGCTEITFWFTNLTSAPWSIFKSNCADSDFVQPESAFVQIADKSILLDQGLMIFWVSFKQINGEPIALIFIPTKDYIGIMMFAFIWLFPVRPSLRSPGSDNDWLWTGENNPILGEQVLEDHREENHFSWFP